MQQRGRNNEIDVRHNKMKGAVGKRDSNEMDVTAGERDSNKIRWIQLVRETKNGIS